MHCFHDANNYVITVHVREWSQRPSLTAQWPIGDVVEWGQRSVPYKSTYTGIYGYCF